MSSIDELLGVRESRILSSSNHIAAASMIALYTFNPSDPEEVGFQDGDIITVLEAYENNDWWKGEVKGRVGIFPRNYAKWNGNAPPLPFKADNSPVDTLFNPFSSNTNSTNPLIVIEDSSTANPFEIYQPGNKRNSLNPTAKPLHKSPNDQATLNDSENDVNPSSIHYVSRNIKPFSGHKQSSCSSCGAPLNYVPLSGGTTNVKCYACHTLNHFNEDVFFDEDIIELVDTSSFSGAPNFKNFFNKKNVMGALNKMKDKATETKERVQKSDFAQKTKEAAKKASEKAKEQTQKAKEQIAEQTQKAKEQIRNTREANQKSKIEKNPSPSSSGTTTPVEPAIPSPNAIFGVSLQQAVERSGKLHPNCPDIVIKCIQYLQNKGVNEEGIFRLSGSANQIKTIRAAFNTGEDVDLSQVRDEHVVSGLLKLYFRELPEEIFPNKHSESFSKVIGCQDPNLIVQNLKIVVEQLPEINRTIIQLLFSLLQEVAKNQEKTKMTISNLAIVFSPTLNCPMDHIKGFIEYYDKIFGS